MKRKRVLVALLAVVVPGGAFVYARCMRPRAWSHAALVVSTPQHEEASTCGIVPLRETLDPGATLSLDVTGITFGDRDHRLSVNWMYCGGLLHRDVYRFTTTFDGIAESRTVSLSDASVVLLSQDGYRLTLHADREDVYSQAP